MILFASQPDCNVVTTNRVTGDVRNDLFFGEDTRGQWRCFADGEPWQWAITGNKVFNSRDELQSFIEGQGFIVEIIH